jgi:hypothetical protein
VEKMNVDPVSNKDDDETDDATDFERQETPRPLEDEAETDLDSEDMKPEPLPAKGSERRVEHETQMRSVTDRPVFTAPSSPPPIRPLPFTKRAATNARIGPLSNGESRHGTGDSHDLDGETDDDEL